MAYTQHEEIGGFGKDRQLSILTTANITGGIIGGVVMWQLTKALGMSDNGFSLQALLQIVLIIIGFLIGTALTLRWDGMSAIDRGGLWLGYHARRLSGDTRIKPRPITIATTGTGMPITTIYRDGQAIIEEYHPPTNEVL